MLKDKNPTTMMYSRTMRPSKVEYAEWFDGPKESISFQDKLLIVVAIAIYAAIIYGFSRY